MLSVIKVVEAYLYLLYLTIGDINMRI